MLRPRLQPGCEDQALSPPAPQGYIRILFGHQLLGTNSGLGAGPTVFLLCLLQFSNFSPNEGTVPVRVTGAGRFVLLPGGSGLQP